MQLANFMSELESSGLLKDDDTAMGHASADAATTAPAAINQDLHGQKATAGLQTPSIAVDAAAAATADVEMAQGDGGDSGEAEQRVLGYLKAAPEWSTVKDMGSQQVGRAFGGGSGVTMRSHSTIGGGTSSASLQNWHPSCLTHTPSTFLLMYRPHAMCTGHVSFCTVPGVLLEPEHQ